MLQMYNRQTLLHPTRFIQVRNVVITRNKKDNKLFQLRDRAKRRRESYQKPGSKTKTAKPKESAASLWLRKDKERQLMREKSELGQNIKKLREFTEQLKLNKLKEEEDRRIKKVEETMPIIDDPEKLINEDINILMQNVIEEEKQQFIELPEPLSKHHELSRLFEYAENEALLKLPTTLIDKIGNSIKYIRNKKTLNWELMIRDMYNSNGLQDMNKDEVTKLLLNIPKNERHKSIAMINEMMSEASIPKDLLIYNLFLTSYAVDKKYEVLCESILEEMTLAGIQPDLYTFSALVKSHGISDNIAKINDTLNMMKTKYGLEPNKQVYTSVLQTCVRLGDHKQAVEVFDMMKFLSQSTQPDAKLYESIILSNVEDDNIERALDLYEEMLSIQGTPTKPTSGTLLMLARGCTSRKELLNRGWQFIFEYHDMKYKPDSKLLETMMYLAAKDGDATFTRALFNTLMESRADELNFNPGKVAINLLMLSYARFSYVHKPVSVLNERVRTLRDRTIDMTNFNFLPPRSPPFLPIDVIISDKSIIAESNAIWAYAVLNFPDFIDDKLVGSYLFAASTKGDSIKEFQRRFETVTFLDESGIPVEEELLGEKKIEIIEEDEEEADPLEQALKTIKSEPPAIQLSFASDFKIARTSEFYNLAIVAAKHFKDLNFANKIWEERGKFRKSDNFKNLPPSKKLKHDFEFAQHILSFFTEMKLLEDLTLIVLSSQNQFNWEWHHIKPTYRLAEVSGNENVKKLLSDAVNNKNYKFRPHYNYTHPTDTK